MAASGTCLQVLTASNLIDAVHNEPVLWNSIHVQRRLFCDIATATCVVQLNSKHVAAIIMSSSSSSILNSKNIYIFVKFVCKLSVGVNFPCTHDTFPSYFFTTNEQVVANFFVINLSIIFTRKLATSPTSPRGRGSYEEVNDVTRKLLGTGPSGIWPTVYTAYYHGARLWCRE